MCLIEDYCCCCYSSAHDDLDNMSFDPLPATTAGLWIGLVEVQVAKPEPKHLPA